MRVFETHAALEAALALPPLDPGAFRFAKQYAPAGFRCADCGEVRPFPFEGGGTGYAVSDKPEPDSLICYACASERERADLIERGRGTLYLCGLPSMGLEADGKGLRVTDWPGGLSFPVHHHSKGRHNIAGTRVDVWFTGPDGGPWHGYSLGEMTQICHVRRIKPTRGGPVAVSHQFKGRGPVVILAHLPSIRAAEEWIARQEKRDPAGIHRGDYGIDAPERLINPPHQKGVGE